MRERDERSAAGAGGSGAVSITCPVGGLGAGLTSPDGSTGWRCGVAFPYSVVKVRSPTGFMDEASEIHTAAGTCWDFVQFCLTRKLRQDPATRGGRRRALSGVLEWLKSDLVAETFELLNGSVFAAQRLASGVIVRAQVDVAFAGGEHVPDGDEGGMLHGGEGFHWASPVLDASVLRAEIRAL